MKTETLQRRLTVLSRAVLARRPDLEYRCYLLYANSAGEVLPGQAQPGPGKRILLTHEVKNEYQGT